VCLASPRCQAIERYRWPGNVRELRNVIERAFVLEESDRLTLSSLPFGTEAVDPGGGATIARGSRLLPEAVASFEREFVETALMEHGFNVKATARAIGVSRQTLYNKMEELGIRPGGGPEGAAP
jgi:DNA-binding NtrC family response regulator